MHSYTAMATNLLVPNIDEEIAHALKLLTAQHRRSATEKRNPESGIARPGPLSEVLCSMPEVGEDADFERGTGVESLNPLLEPSDP